MDIWEKSKTIQTDESQVWCWNQERGGRVVGHEAREGRRQTLGALETIVTTRSYSAGMGKAKGVLSQRVT